MKTVTTRKPEISNDLKYPIGFELIVAAVQEIKSEKILRLNFANKIGGEIGQFAPYSFGHPIVLKNNAKELLDFTKIISLKYSIIQDEWAITIYPCDKKDSNIYKKFFREIGLNLCKYWLEIERFDTWYEGQRFFEIGLNQNHSKFCTLETQNEYIIDKNVGNNNYA